MAFTTEAKNAVAIDALTGDVLFEHNAYDKVPPSSMSKLMTLYVAFSKIKDGTLKETDLVSVSMDAWKRGGSTMFLKERQKVSVMDLINGIAVVSGNDASIAIAEAIKGDQDSFAVEMNDYAQKLNLHNSYFVNSTGWPEDGHYMSVYDIALLSRRLFYDFNQYYGIFSNPSLESNGIKQTNTNQLIFRNSANVKIDGIKTGHSDIAGYGVAVSAYNQNGNRIFVVVNGLQSSVSRFFEAQKIVNYIFDNFEFKKFYTKNEQIGNVKVYYGKEKKLPVATDEDVFLVYNNRDNITNIKTSFVYNDEIKAPVKQGDKVGELVIAVDNKREKKYNLYAMKSIEELPFIKKFMYKIFAISNTKK